MGRPRVGPGTGLTVPGRVLERLDRLQQRRAALGFAYAVVRKYADDGGGREAALITYYGFLSIFPALLLAEAVVGRALSRHPELRQRLFVAMVPPSLQSTVASAATAAPASRVAVAAGVIALLLSSTGVVLTAARTVNHLAAVPHRLRTGTISRPVRAVAALILILGGAVTVGCLVVAVTACPGVPWISHVLAVIGEGAIVFTVLLLVARLLLLRPAPTRALWPAAAPAAVAATITLELGAVVLPRLVRQAGPVYGGFATVAGMFTLLYVLSIALVFAAEIATVREARLWPRAVDRSRPTVADAHALALLAREQERIPGQRVESRLPTGPPTPPAGRGGGGAEPRRSGR
ncbi:YhjD/YihY/BrkB family envelope integrity protein [Actinoplanes sp. NPDC051346]|uniref:YhjD/YihY/BrkB family envelope integrity protein n=1 Tax=Actinoplanes sp. NPDC051346 TaxID=3155048 RepID=UPI00341BAC5B